MDIRFFSETIMKSSQKTYFEEIPIYSWFGLKSINNWKTFLELFEIMIIIKTHPWII